MIATLVTKERTFSISLPEKVSGQYWILDADSTGHPRRVANVEGIGEKWFLRGSEYLALMEAGVETPAVELRTAETQVVSACYREDGVQVQVFVEPATAGRQSFRKYMVPESCRLNIGRTGDNHIIFENRYVSAHHACLVWEQGKWSITDTQSSNGTFVNQRRIAMADMLPGDTAYIMGLKVIAGNGFFAINDPDGQVRVNAPAITPFEPQPAEPRSEIFETEPEGETFYRSPRFCRSIARGEIHLDPPPAKQRVEEVPLPLLLGPALTMGMTAVIMAVIAIVNYNNGTSNLLSTIPSVAMAFTMLCGTILWPMLTKRNEKKRAKEAERVRQNKYREYLDGVRNEIFALSAAQKEILTENAPNVAECGQRIVSRDRKLWERSGGHGDFLRLRLGLGSLPLNAEIRMPDKRFTLDDDYLLNDVLRLADEPKILEDVPITCSLRDNPVMGIVGEREEGLAFVQGLVLQLAALHSYDEAKLVFLTAQDEDGPWRFARWLPHVWNEDGTARCLASDETAAKALSANLERVLADRLEDRERSGGGGKIPHYILIVDGLELAEHTAIYHQVLSAPAGAGFSCVVLASRLQDLPKECSTVVELNGAQGSIYDQNDVSGQRQTFRCESAGGLELEQAAYVLGNLRMDTRQEQYALPNMLTFLELYGVGKVEHLNALTRWKANNPVNTLEVPVGVGSGGEKFYLDLHEKFHGPHGLVAGMTGSGKSEFIITFILSLAVNFHPDEVSFILIDYKGGGLAGAFEDSEKGIRLPHLAGTITNLDGTAVKRSLISIQSELRRRQAVFNEARRVSGEGTIDIYKYQKMYRSGLVAEPVPHLFIISDEFAELKSQQPEFMAQLISAARIGRSLGVHLILATQKPSGVVDDQIWSNSRFRVCLKVQERADSMDMIKRPDAAELAETGRFYLQVGFNEFFALGQSAWCGAPYSPADRVEKKRDESIAVLDELGRVLAEAKPQTARNDGSGVSQIVSVVKYLSALAEGEHIHARQLWLPPIPAVITLDGLRQKYHWKADPLELEAVVGEYDDPFNQTQGLLTVPFSREGNTLVYASAGGGKTTFLNTLLYGLLTDYDASRLNLYLIDLGEETLRAFEDAPQVGGVLYSDEGEKIVNLFKMLLEEMAYRKKLFAADDGNYSAYCRRTGHAVPHILVVLRNYAAFSEEFDNLEEQLLRLTREGSKYGIFFLVTASAANSVRYRMSQNFSKLLALQLNDKADYVGLLGSTDGVFPSRIKGRGICKTDKVYEFQTAHFAEDSSPDAVRTFAAELASHAGSFARPVPTLPDRVTWKEFREAAPDAFPVGIEKAALRPARTDLTRSVILPVTGQDLYEVAPTAQGIAELLTRLEGAVTVLDGDSVFMEPEDVGYSYLNKNFPDRVEALFNEMVRRNNTYKTAKMEDKPLPVFTPEYYVITGIQTILDGLDAEGKDKLNTLLERAEPEYNICFILCGSAQAVKAQTSAPWYRRHISGKDGVWVGDGISEQYLLNTGKLTNALYSELPPHFGYLVRKGRPTQVKLLVGEQWEGDEEG